MRDCEGRGVTGFCGNGRHSHCPYTAGNVCEHGIWGPECYITWPRKSGARVTISDPQGWGGAAAVCWPRHRYRCPCPCHESEPAGQLDLFATAVS